MKIEKIFTAFLTVFLGLALIYMFSRNTGNSITAEALANESQKQTRILSFNPKTTGSTEPGDALVELTPQVADNNRLIVNFSINTHSVSLRRFDLKEITTLEYGGKVLKPVRASRIGGHHSSGTIIFDTGKDFGSFTIRIQGIPKVVERIYEWNMG